MGKQKVYRYFVGDFETTVYEGQIDTEVWASGSCELFTEQVNLFTSIQEQFAYYYALKSDIIVYYHNLKFDGSFILDYLLIKEKYKQAYVTDKDENYSWLADKDMPRHSLKYSISDMGQWYQIILHTKSGCRIVFQDSLKLLPFSVKRIGQAFKTKHQKLEIEYEGERHAFGKLTDEEKRYLTNDLLVIKEAIEIMHQEGHTKLTIGSCCMAEYKQILKKSMNPNIPDKWDECFPNLYKQKLVNFNEKTAGEFIHKSYKGGWTYVVPEKSNKLFFKGVTADVNSLYPSVMSSESGNYYPIGDPHFWKGDIPKAALKWDRYYFVQIETEFYIKDGYLPFIQIKNDLLYKSTECLKTSCVWDKEKHCWYKNRVTLTLTMTDYELIKEHYDLIDCKIISGCWFYSSIGIFDEYIEKYKKIKLTAKGALRELAKLFLNNLYGKMASSTDSSFKIAQIDGNKLYFITQKENNKEPGYIPIGSAITSYARNFTIRHAQKNYHGPDKPGFIYADTDSIHCDLEEKDLIDIKVHPVNFCCWKVESYWDKAIFVRPKTYIEHITHEDGEPIEKPYHQIKCAGMPDRCKELLKMSFDGVKPSKEEFNKMKEEEVNFLIDKNGEVIRRGYTDFKRGLSVPGKLRPFRMPGGILLIDTPYVMRN